MNTVILDVSDEASVWTSDADGAAHTTSPTTTKRHAASKR